MHFSQCIAETEFLTHVLDERLDLCPWTNKYHCEPGRYNEIFRAIDLSGIKAEYFESPLPNVLIHHENCLAFKVLGTKTKLGINKNQTLEPRGRVDDVLNKFYYCKELCEI
jgi:hypothetical protein